MAKIKTYYIIFPLIFLIVLLLVPNLIINLRSRYKTFTSANQIPYNKVGLLLGTSKYIKRGTINLYYKYRIEAAVELFNLGKIDFILISGDNGLIEYNEPRTIRNDLIKMGIPSDKIFSDYAGFRTWDSIIRAKKVFGETKFTVISQEFQNQRAIFIARRHKMEVIGYNAKDVPKNYGAKIRLREKFARINLMFDLLINKQPRYLGNTIEIK